MIQLTKNTTNHFSTGFCVLCVCLRKRKREREGACECTAGLWPATIVIVIVEMSRRESEREGKREEEYADCGLEKDMLAHTHIYPKCASVSNENTGNILFFLYIFFLCFWIRFDAARQLACEGPDENKIRTHSFLPHYFCGYFCLFFTFYLINLLLHYYHWRFRFSAKPTVFCFSSGKRTH